MAKTQILGTVSVVPMGDWNSTTTYQKGNYVRYNKATYMAKVANVNVTPGVSTNWQQIWMLCNYDGVAEIASETPLPDTENGAVGQSTAYAREDHQHKMSAIYESASAANAKWQAQEEVNDTLTEGVNEALSDIPLSPEQTGVAITGENTLAGAGVSVVLESRNLFNIGGWNGTSIQTGGYIRNAITLSDGVFTNPISQYNDFYSPNIQIPVKKGKVTVSADVQCPEEGYLQFSFGFSGPTEMVASTEYKTLTAEDTEWHNYQATFDVGKDGICYFGCANRTATTGENYSVKFRNIQVESGEIATPYTPYVAEGTSVNVTACGENFLYTADGTVQNGDYVVSANNGEITFTRGETYVGIWKISNEIGWSTTGNYINDWKDETVYGGSDPLVMSWSYEGNIDRTGAELYPRIVPIYKDGTANDQIQVFAQNSITLEAKPIAAIALFMSGTIPDGWKIKVQLSKTTTPYTPYTGATYPATVGQSVEIVQYDKITNVFTDNAGVTVSAAFKQSTRYELDTKPVSLAGTYAERPTGIYPYVVLYTATDRSGETYRLEANADGSVSANWVQINGIYQHNIVMSQTTGPFFSVTIRSRDNYAYAFSRLIEWFNGKGLNVQGKDYSDVAGAFKNDSGELHIITHTRASGSGLQVSGVNITTGNVADFTINEVATCVDTVITI